MSIRRLWITPALLLALGAGPALAQFRPPPMTEAQRLSSTGDQPRLEGSRLLAAGDKKGAEAQFTKALGYYEQALKADPQLLVAAEGLGMVGNALGQHQKVIALLTPVSAAHPEADDVSFSLGVAYFKSRSYEQAVPLLEKARVGNNRAHLVAHYYLAQYHLATGRGDLAEVALSSYLALRPESVARDDHEIHALIGKAFLLQRRPAQARAAFERAQQGREELPALQVGLASVLELEGKRAAAITKLEAVSQKFPKAAEPKDRLARLLLEDGRSAQAEKVAQQLLALSASGPNHLLLAEIHLAQKRYPEAEAQARKALAVVPGLLLAQVRLGTALQAQGKHDEAINILQKAVAASGDSYEALAALGSANRRAGRVQKALEAHQAAFKLAPRYPTSHLLLGADYFVANDWDKAISHYSSALQLVPGDARATHWLALSYARRGKARSADPKRIEEAIGDLSRAFDLESSAAVARGLGALLVDAGRFEEAVHSLQVGSARPDADWQNFYLLGHAQLGAGRPAEALAAFKSAAAAAPNADIQAEISAATGLALGRQGKLDEAISLLEKAGGVKAAAVMAQANLPVLRYHRALVRLSQGEVGGAREDVQAADRLPEAHPDQASLGKLANALLDMESGDEREAAAQLRAARLEKADWLAPGSAVVLEGYRLYRAQNLPQLKKHLRTAVRGSGPAARFANSLLLAGQRKEAERQYASGNLKGAEAGFKAALKAQPGSAALAVNLATAQYGRGASAAKAAGAVWGKYADKVPEATLNLGIDALERGGNLDQALGYFEDYVSRGGSRSGQVREWSERLKVLRGRGAVAAGGVQ